MNMIGSIDMLSVIAMPAPRGPVPDGMKVTSLGDPNKLQPAPSNPALAVGGFTLWPMSYMDNRVSFGMVMYDLKWRVTNVVEKAGARYIYKITLEGSGENGTVTFWGQADQKVTMTVGEICDLLCGK
jgi:hypothetical protein